MGLHLRLCKVSTINGVKQIDASVPFTMAHILVKTNSNVVDPVLGNPYYGVHTKCTVKMKNPIVGETDQSYGQVDEKPTNLVEALRTLYEIADDDSNLQTLRDAEAVFSTGTTVDTLLPFEISVQRQSINTSSGSDVLGGASLWFGDMEHTDSYINFSARLNRTGGTIAACYLLVNDLYSSTSIKDMLQVVRATEQAWFNNKQYGKYLNLPQFAPIYPYVGSPPISNTLQEYRSYLPTSTPTLRVMLQKGVNLCSWGNWYRMLSGVNPTSTGFRLNLPMTVLGHDRRRYDYIDLGIPYNPFDNVTGIDIGASNTTEWTRNIDTQPPTGNYTTKGFRYFVQGTNICNLFEDESTDSTPIKEVFLPTGILSQSYGTGTTSLRYNISVGGSYVSCFVGRKDVSAHGNTYYGVGTSNVQLFVTNAKYAKLAMSNWVSSLPENPQGLNGWNWSDYPISFVGYSVSKYSEGIKYSYITGLETAYDAAGLVGNYSSGSASSYNNIIDTTNMTREMWVELLSGYATGGGTINLGGGSIGGASNGVGGGYGGYNDTSTIVTNTGDIINLGGGIISGGAGKFMHLYGVSPISLGSFVDRMWTIDWSRASIFGNSTNPSECVLLIKRYPFRLPTSSSGNYIQCAGQQISVSEMVRLVSQEHKYIDFGWTTIPEYFGNCLDYNKTILTLYLPYVGVHEIDTKSIMGGKVRLEAYIDIINGVIIYLLSLNKNGITNVICSWQGSIGVEYTLTGLDTVTKLNGVKNAVATAIGSTASSAIMGGSIGGGPGAAIGAGAGLIRGGFEVIGSLWQQMHTVKSGNFNGSRFGIKYPYISVERPKMTMPPNYGSKIGFVSNTGGTLGSYSGFTVVGECHLQNMSYATKGEIDECEKLLKQGVII